MAASVCDWVGPKWLASFFLFPDYPFRKASDSDDSPLANPRTRFSKRIIGEKKKRSQPFGYRFNRAFNPIF
jgi:hypothetical protein